MRMNEKIMNYKFDGSRVFFTSDTHFNHANIIRFCNRPFKDVSHMNEAIISNWNRVVGPEDIVFHLGDFCLGSDSVIFWKVAPCRHRSALPAQEATASM